VDILASNCYALGGPNDEARPGGRDFLMSPVKITAFNE